MTRIKSTDPLKAEVVRNFRHRWPEASKVVDVMDLGGDVFQATLHRHLGNRKYERLGVFKMSILFVPSDSRSVIGQEELSDKKEKI